MTHSGDEDDEFYSVDRCGSIEPNFLKKKQKNNQKIRKVRVRREKFESIPLSSVRLEIRLKFDSFTTSR
jgi:hypothetical protein